MTKKKLRLQAGDLIKHTKKKLSSEFVELSEKDLQQIVGGVAAGGSGEWRDKL
jgi:bacteriocin-like protein